MGQEPPSDINVLFALVLSKHSEVTVENRVMRTLFALTLSEKAKEQIDPESFVLRLTEALRVGLHKTWPEADRLNQERWNRMEDLVDEIGQQVRFFAGLDS